MTVPPPERSFSTRRDALRAGDGVPWRAVQVGQIVDEKYEILRRIGKGGMGVVFEARHVPSGASVAIKVVTAADMDDDTDSRRRFEREARAASSIESPHIPRVIDTGTDGASGMPFMVMD